MTTKIAVAAAFLLSTTGLVQAQAPSADCTEAGMTKMQSQIDAMADENQPAQKTAAMADLEKAKSAMQANDMDDCKAHMEKVMQSVMPG